MQPNNRKATQWHDWHPNGHDRLYVNAVGMQSWHEYWCDVFRRADEAGTCDCRDDLPPGPGYHRPASGAPPVKIDEKAESA